MAAEGNDGAPVRIEDPTKHLTRRRIDEILDRQRSVLDQHMRAKDMMALDEIDLFTAQDMVYSAVLNLMSVTRALFRRVDNGKRYWNGSDDWPALGIIPHPEGGDPIEVESLGEFYYLDTPVEFNVTSETVSHIKGKQVTIETYQVNPPIPLSLDAYDLINDFVRGEVGLDLELEPQSHRSDNAGV